MVKTRGQQKQLGCSRRPTYATRSQTRDVGRRISSESENDSDSDPDNSDTSGGESGIDEDGSDTSGDKSDTSKDESSTGGDESDTGGDKSDPSRDESNTSEDGSNTSGDESNTSEGGSDASEDKSGTSGDESDTSGDESDDASGIIAKGRSLKRRKVASTIGKALGKRPLKTFSLLLSMPMDIIFEVTGHLTPKDLIALSWTSRALRETLHSSNFSSVWKAARSAIRVPDCSPGFLEPQWAVLLFGRPACQHCGAKNIHNVEFGIRRRLCNRCKKEYLISAVKFKEEYPEYEAVVMDMVPYTRVGGQAPVRAYRGKFFWPSDIERIGSEWAVLRGKVRRRVKGARAKATAYKEKHIDEVERIAQHAKVCDEWARCANEESRKDLKERRMTRLDEIQARLRALGYEAQARDINCGAFYRRSFHKGTELTDELWARMRPKAVALVESHRRARIEWERAQVKLQRTKKLEPLYLEYVKSLAPLQWCYLPDVYELAEIPVFKKTVEASWSFTVSSSHFLHATARLPTLVPEWISAKRARITAMLGPLPGAVRDPLDLATSVFECTSGACYTRPVWESDRHKLPLISWEVIAAHSCQAAGRYTSLYISTKVGVSDLGGTVAAALVRRAGLDPASASITEMDALDLRFACLECPPSSAGSCLKVGYPWKSAVEHGMETQHKRWHKMSRKEATRVKQNEKDGSEHLPSWSCSHCARNLNDWHSKDRVIQHLSDMHQITSPTEPADLFWYPGKYRISSLILASTEIVEPKL